MCTYFLTKRLIFLITARSQMQDSNHNVTTCRRTNYWKQIPRAKVPDKLYINKLFCYLYLSLKICYLWFPFRNLGCFPHVAAIWNVSEFRITALVSKLYYIFSFVCSILIWTMFRESPLYSSSGPCPEKRFCYFFFFLRLVATVGIEGEMLD